MTFLSYEMKNSFTMVLKVTKLTFEASIETIIEITVDGLIIEIEILLLLTDLYEDASNFVESAESWFPFSQKVSRSFNSVSRLAIYLHNQLSHTES